MHPACGGDTQGGKPQNQERIALLVSYHLYIGRQRRHSIIHLDGEVPDEGRLCLAYGNTVVRRLVVLTTYQPMCYQSQISRHLNIQLDPAGLEGSQGTLRCSGEVRSL